jgi:hypothetical protein
MSNRNTTVEVPALLVAKGRRLGYKPLELLQVGMQSAHGSLVPGRIHAKIKQSLDGRSTGLLLVCGVIGSQYNEVAREIMAMIVKDESRSDCTPLVFCRMVTHSQIAFACVAAHRCIVIASLHSENIENVEDQISLILNKEGQDDDLNLIGIVEARAVYLDPVSNIRLSIEIEYHL